jgi:translation initiation factor 2A
MASGGGGKSKSQVKREKLKKEKAAVPVKNEETPIEQRQVAAADPEKRARKIKKTLKQIEDLKQKSDLNDDEKAKLATEEELRAELEQLGL